jgi:1-acyl-sn-glycerol-3-phosphate acyltransferase
MPILHKFNEIRPYRDEEIPQMMSKLLNDPVFTKVLRKLFHDDIALEKVQEEMASTRTIESFQLKFMVPFLQNIVNTSTNGLFISGLDNLEKNQSYLFISNHRDIVLDSAFLNLEMYHYGYKPTQIAMGSNLLIWPWIEDLSRVNRSIIVKRNIPVKQMLDSSKLLSEYMRHSIKNNGDSVWIAQREGRAKDGFDQTQPSLLKMLNMSNKKSSFVDGFSELRIVPMAISYEIEPCGNEKVAELLERQTNPDFHKTEMDDLLSMASGLKNPKGRVQIQFAPPITRETLKEISTEGSTNDDLKNLAEYIDKQIYANYRLYPNNYIAYDSCFKSLKYSDKYTSEEKVTFFEMTHQRLHLVNQDRDEALELWLKMYATPVVNRESCMTAVMENK